MKLLPARDTLEIEVTDFGPIVEAKVDLRPLTVFIGPSNTGKSYLAILIYALHRYFSNDEPHNEQLFEPFWAGSQEWRSKNTEDLAAFVKLNLGEMDEATVKESIALTPPLADEIRSVFDDQGTAISNEISRCFGNGRAGVLIRKGARDRANVILRRHCGNDLAPFAHEVTVDTRKTTFRATVPAETSMRINTRQARTLHMLCKTWAEITSTTDQADYQRSSFPLFRLLGEIARHHVVGPLHFPAFYLPADRTGVMHAHSAVVSAMIKNAPMTGLRPTVHTPMLSGVLADFLQQLIELARPSHQQPERSRHDLGEKIEKAILQGSVHVHWSDISGYPSFTYRPEGWKNALPLMNTSSMVSELAPVVLYLRHTVRPDNLLIVEEPESHLHPAMQVEFTRQLASLVRSGVRVIVTTHSEWVLEELANIVRRSALSDPSRTEPASADVALWPEEVGAWLFKPKRRPKGSVVEEVMLDEETGIYPTDYDAVSEALYNESANIFNRIQDSKTQ